jgi:hypothetical protein
MEWYEILVSILSGLAVTIPLVVQLVRYVEAATKEKNWGKVLDLVIDLMEQAEVQFDKGNDKKQWVLSMIEASANTLNYDIDLNQIGELIDALCAMAKIVNAPKIEE